MSDTTTPADQGAPDFGVAEIQASLRKIERRDLWAWGNTIVVILGLTAIIVSLAVSMLLNGTKTLFGINLVLAIQVLIVFVPAFNFYMIHQHFRLRNLQRELAEHQVQAEVFQRLAMYDPLTGLYNRRFAEQRLQAEIGRCERRGHHLSIVLLDLNNFKQINDTCGHPAGDLVLKDFAQLLRNSIRASDLAVRWGGDEFLLLLVDCNLEQIQHVLVRLAPFDIAVDGKTLTVSFAVGWKEYAPGDRVVDLLAAADRELYADKVSMKNHIPLIPTAV